MSLHAQAHSQSRRVRAPTWVNEYKNELLKAPIPTTGIREDVFLDSMSTRHMLRSKSVPTLPETILEKPIHVLNSGGTTESVNKTVNAQKGGIPLKHALKSDKVPVNLSSVGQLNNEGFSVYMGPKVGAVVKPEAQKGDASTKTP